MQTPQYIIEHFGLLPHPEGGWYKETYRSNESIAQNDLPARFKGDRAFSIAIYFLMEQGNFSAFHKIKSDECWHFYAGSTLEIYILYETGLLETIRLGNNIEQDELFQYVVPANTWFASRPAPGSDFSFTGCTVAPGFDFEDFELAEKAILSAQFPNHKNIIEELCRS